MKSPVLDGDGQGLLEGFIADIVDDDYATPSSAKAHAGAGALVVGVVIGVIGLIVAVALVSTRLSSGERQQTRADLTARISELSVAVADRQVVVGERASAVDSLQARVLAQSEDGPATAAQLARLSLSAGATAIAGPGVIVTIDDAPDAEQGSLNRVLDRDLQDIVNALWRQGAQGVAVNEQRLTSTTAIRAAGESILVNYVPLTRPYLVSGLGTASTGSGDSDLQRLLRQLTRDYGLVTDMRTGDVALPAGELRAPRFATIEDPMGVGSQ